MKQYPQAPVNVNPLITEPSALYKQEVVKSISAIVLFIITYLLLIVGASFLAYYCVLLGIGILSVASGGLVFVAAGGVILIGLITLFFVFKFIFTRNKTDRSQLYEITESEQPILFEFIRNITKETQAPFPKKIYLSNEVNASVFYDSSFFSMFLPVKKNLLIGLGLVNSVTISEFKAIMAHEFGHFSQKSMKVGSYVYNSNRIIHNLLYDNGGFYNTLNSIARVHMVLYVCMYLVSGVVKVIQYVLNKMYLFINKQNMKLSREMEFHADSVAASVAGSKPLITSLYRLELAESSFSNVLSVCNILVDEKKQESNIYSSHLKIMNDIAKDNKIAISNNLPEVNRNTFSDFDTTRINISNQWASHPSTPDREAKLLEINLTVDSINDSAWNIFTNPSDLQVQMTKIVYQTINEPEGLEIGDFAEMKYFEQKNFYELPVQTNGYWDNKDFPEIEFDNVIVSSEKVYEDEVIHATKRLNGMDLDINNLHSILAKEITISSFDFEGEKYNTKDAQLVLESIQNEKSQLEREILENDRKILWHHYSKAEKLNKKEEFLQIYNGVLDDQKKQKSYFQTHQNIINQFMPLLQGQQMTTEQAQIMVRSVQQEEFKIKEDFRLILDDEKQVTQLSESTLSSLKSLADSNRIYFLNDNFKSENINALFNDLQKASTALIALSMKNKKQLLSF